MTEPLTREAFIENVRIYNENQTAAKEEFFKVLLGRLNVASKQGKLEIHVPYGEYGYMDSDTEYFKRRFEENHFIYSTGKFHRFQCDCVFVEPCTTFHVIAFKL